MEDGQSPAGSGRDAWKPGRYPSPQGGPAHPHPLHPLRSTPQHRFPSFLPERSMYKLSVSAKYSIFIAHLFRQVWSFLQHFGLKVVCESAFHRGKSKSHTSPFPATPSHIQYRPPHCQNCHHHAGTIARRQTSCQRFGLHRGLSIAARCRDNRGSRSRRHVVWMSGIPGNDPA